MVRVELLAHTQLSRVFKERLAASLAALNESGVSPTDGQIVALSAIRNCYSATEPTAIFNKEYRKYFERQATDGGTGSEAERLFRQIVRSGHLSTMEHLSFTFAIEGVSRALLAQLTRHRVGFSFSVESQRYTRLGTRDKSGGFDYVTPPSVRAAGAEAEAAFHEAMRFAQQSYDVLRSGGVPPEDSRSVLPNAAVTNIVMTANFRALLDFYSKRKPGSGAQWEIADLAEQLRTAVATVEPWTDQFFDQ